MHQASSLTTSCLYLSPTTWSADVTVIGQLVGGAVTGQQREQQEAQDASLEELVLRMKGEDEMWILADRGPVPSCSERSSVPAVTVCLAGLVGGQAEVQEEQSDGGVFEGPVDH